MLTGACKRVRLAGVPWVVLYDMCKLVAVGCETGRRTAVVMVPGLGAVRAEAVTVPPARYQHKSTESSANWFHQQTF